ncbi:PP2C family protein-serine/threonine phosphatase [uncultured Jannaschia sp.]|uniref:PP2C family protein-serine/threonine phosphatase n=1 Tax=uncultured Jannaschia sp. TaxID=293347 RepID=UPI002605912E|nr:response regulator [uncultured Jannaschia sp.]
MRQIADLEPTTVHARIRVLVVDDSASQRALLSRILAGLDLDVVTAPDAGCALHILMSDEAAEIRMILSDWQMPGMDGPDLCRAVRELARDRYAYFILMTSETNRGMKARGLEAGADDFVTRPVDMAELRARITTGRRILRMQEELIARNREVRSALDDLRALHDGIQRDLAEARKLQRAFLAPRHHTVDGAELSLRLVTSGQIGGDLVGHFAIDATRIGLISIDVSGHGIASALLTGRLAGLFSWRSRWRNIAFPDPNGPPASPEVVMDTLNEFMLQELTSDIYFTAVLAYVDLRTGRVRLCQAGHPHPLIRRAGGHVERVGAGGPPVGLIPGATFECIEARLAPGDSFLAYSDGLTECVDAEGRMLDEEGLMAILAEISGPTEDGVEQVTDGLNAHAGGVAFDDDISMLLLRFDGAAAGAGTGLAA